MEEYKERLLYNWVHGVIWDRIHIALGWTLRMQNKPFQNQN